MNEERKPKKLNIKKVAVVALSVIMLMTMFCLSAFADNPLTSKTEYILSQTEIPSFDPEFTNETGEYQENFVTNNELDVTITFIDKNGNEFTSAGLMLTTIEDNMIEISTMDTYRIITKYEKSGDNKWLLTTNEKYIIAGATDSDYEELSIEEASTAVNNAIETLLTNIENTNILDIFQNVQVIETNQLGILSTFLSIGTWIGGAVSALIGMFYLNGSLTFIGYLAVAALAVSVVFLLIYLISSFLKFRG